MIDEIRSRGYELYGVSGDTSDVQINFVETRDLQYHLLSDPEFSFYTEAGITAPGTSINRGVVVYTPDGEVAYAETTEDAASALLNYLDI